MVLQSSSSKEEAVVDNNGSASTNETIETPAAPVGSGSSGLNKTADTHHMVIDSEIKESNS